MSLEAVQVFFGSLSAAFFVGPCLKKAEREGEIELACGEEGPHLNRSSCVWGFMRLWR